jgi:energy-coupling factor transport system permease protein
MVAVSTVEPTLLHPSLQPLRWPDLPSIPAATVLLGLLPAWIAPPVRLPAMTTIAPPTLEHAA